MQWRALCNPMQRHKPKGLLTTEQVAARKGVNPSTVTRWVKAGRLKAANPPPDGKKSARYLFTPADVDNLT